MLLVRSVIIGGISRISIVISKLVPVMRGFFSQTVEEGLVGILVQGVRRSFFCNKAGLGRRWSLIRLPGSKNKFRRELFLCLELTVIIYNLIALVILMTGIYGYVVEVTIDSSISAALAFGQVISWFPFVLARVMDLFAFSTLITWCYYGERC